MEQAVISFGSRSFYTNPCQSYYILCTSGELNFFEIPIQAGLQRGYRHSQGGEGSKALLKFFESD